MAVMPIADVKLHWTDADHIAVAQSSRRRALTVDQRAELSVKVSDGQSIIVQLNLAMLIRHHRQRDHQVTSRHPPDDRLRTPQFKLPFFAVHGSGNQGESSRPNLQAVTQALAR